LHGENTLNKKEHEEMRSKECQECGNLNFVPKLVELIDEKGVIRLVEICRVCEVMIGENPLSLEQTLSWYIKHNVRKGYENLTWNGWRR